MQAKMKENYDDGTVVREFQVGEQVGHPLQVRYQGPYVVKEKRQCSK